MKRTSAKKRAPRRSHSPDVAVLLIDVINDLAFPGGAQLRPWAERAAARIAKFCSAARRRNVPVIYVNDNFGRWRDSADEIYEYCTRRSAPGRAMVKAVRPARRDFFILKPRHSAFYSTSLVPLLEELGARRLILAGFATNLCVLFTAHDAHMRGYAMTVLSDCCAAETDFDHNVALKQLERFCDADVCRSDEYWTR